MKKPLLSQPKTFLFSVRTELQNEKNKKEGTWSEAAEAVLGETKDLYESFPPDPPRRRYYGPKGSLRTPFH